MTPPFRDFPLGLKFIFLFFLLFFNIELFEKVALFFVPMLFGIDDPDKFNLQIPGTPNQIHAFLFVQIISVWIGGFLITSFAFAWLESGAVLSRLRLNTTPGIKNILLAVFSILVAQFFIDFLIRLNSEIRLPSSLGFLYDLQKQNNDFNNALLNFKSFREFMYISTALAVFPAICEEIFFRGLLLGALLKGGVRPWIAIVTTGFVFAVSHMEFDNTIAIWLLGAFLGYLYYTSGSLWLPMAVHFTNNLMGVGLKYLYNTGHISSDIAEASTPLYATVISILIFSGCIFIFNRWNVPPDFRDYPDEPEQLSE